MGCLRHGAADRPRGDQGQRKEAELLAPFRSRGFRPYAIGTLGVAIASLLRFLFDPFLGEHLSFSFDYLAVFVAAWTGGMWPAIATASISSLVSSYFFT